MVRVDELNSENIPTMTKKQKIVKDERARAQKKTSSPHRLLLTHSSFGLFDSVNAAANYTRSVELYLVFGTIYYVFLFSLSRMRGGFYVFHHVSMFSVTIWSAAAVNSIKSNVIPPATKSPRPKGQTVHALRS